MEGFGNYGQEMATCPGAVSQWGPTVKPIDAGGGFARLTAARASRAKALRFVGARGSSPESKYPHIAELEAAALQMRVL